MQRSLEVEFKTLLTKEEYERLIDMFKDNHSDIQTNHYFDTPRFSLKALESSLRVRERDALELTLKKKKGYAVQEYTLPITEEMFEQIKATGEIPESELRSELIPLIGSQKLVNFLSLSTKRTYTQYKKGILFLDKSTFCGVTDYELEYEARNYLDGKKEFIELINDLQIQYKKSEKKVQRAFKAYKNKKCDCNNH